MPLVRQPTLVTITFRDRARKSSSQFYIGDSGGNPPPPMQLGNPNVAPPYAYLQELYDNLKDVSDCAGVGYSVTYSWMEEPLLAIPETGNPNVERKGVFQFGTARGGKSIFTVPGIKLAAQAADGRHLIYTLTAGEPVFGGSLAGDLQSIHDKLRNGPTIDLATYPVTSYLGDDFTSFVDAYQQTRASSGKG